MNYINPIPFLESLKGKKVNVQLKWGNNYRGILSNYDHYFNVSVTEAEEWHKEQFKGKLSEIIIRCNNVLYIQQVQGEDN